MSSRINVVYANMECERLDVVVPDIDAEVFWTRKEASGSDIVIYLNGYSFNRANTRKNPEAFRILCAYEPLSVYPAHFLRRYWRHFDAVLTWNDHLAAAGGKFFRFPTLCYDFPFGAVHGVLPERDEPLPEPSSRRRALCQIVGDKYSPVAGQLYSLRRSIARWFHTGGTLDMDVYGMPAMNVPNYKGAVESKLDTLRQYRYALCFENLHHPVWSQGYVTEKIFDCMYADCVPVYYGACNVEKIIPEDCFIDFRRFSGFAGLDVFLAELTDNDYMCYVRQMREFLKTHHASRRYSCFRLYEKALELASSPPAPQSGDDPLGFWQTASFFEKIRGALMMAAVPVHRKFRNMLCTRPDQTS